VVKLTYEQLGAQLGLSAAAARMRAKRNHWPITTGNDGRALVEVDESELAAARTKPERPAEQPPEHGPNRSAERLPEPGERSPEQAEQPAMIAREVAELQVELARAQEQVAAEKRVAAAEIAAAKAESVAKEQVIADLRQVLDRERRQHQERVDELRRDLEHARRPWWRRLLD
jgi:hypothetical protein